MATERFPIGTTLLSGDVPVADTPTYTAVPNVVAIGLPFGYEVDEEEITTHGSSGTNKLRAFAPTLADNGSIDFEVLFDWEDTEHITKLAVASWGRTKRAWKLELPIQTSGNTTKATLVFDGHISSLPSPTADAQGHLRMTGSIRIDSAATFTAESA